MAKVMAEVKQFHEVVLGAEKTVTTRPAVTRKFSKVTVFAVTVEPAKKRITAQTNLGQIILREGTGFPLTWSLSKTAIETEIKSQVSTGPLNLVK